MSPGATKAQILNYLRPRVTRALILPAAVITVGQWHDRRTTLARELIQQFHAGTPLIVRSSHLAEGHGQNSRAGQFLTVRDVTGEDALSEAIDAVIHSYGQPEAMDQLLIQPMAQDLTASGVATNCDLRTGKPYLLVDLARGSDSTVVTAGKAVAQSFTVLRIGGGPTPNEIRPIAALIEELEEIYPRCALEVEFGMTADAVILFQCRIAANDLASPAGGSALLQRTREARRDAGRSLAAARSRCGAAAFGVMPDWNPAEMIGLKPTPLAFDLYAHLITDRTWAEARRHQGYADVAAPLMVRLQGTPYIDIAASLSSFVPADVPLGVRRRVVAASIERLRGTPRWHDKIEFEILPTCSRQSIAHGDGVLDILTPSERAWYNACLLRLTNDLVRPRGGFDLDFACIGKLEALLRDTRAVPPHARPSFVTLLGQARNIAAPLFARVARAAFVATDIVRGIEACQPGAGASDLLVTAHGVADALLSDLMVLDRTEFLRRHGHVRPGTYDIRVPSYEEAPERYFPPDETLRPSPGRRVDPDDRAACEACERAFQGIGYAFTASDFVSFARRAIWAREQVKEIYAALVSEALSALVRAVADCGIPRDLLAFATLADLDGVLRRSEGALATLERRRDDWIQERDVRVPLLVFSMNDLFAWEEPQSAPNFITRAHVVARTAVVSQLEGVGAGEACCGRIIVTEQADPGYDWIFTHPIAGLVTAYGGLNSHMAVRCREMNVPAVIGTGPSVFAKLSHARMLSIDCASQRLEICR